MHKNQRIVLGIEIGAFRARAASALENGELLDNCELKGVIWQNNPMQLKKVLHQLVLKLNLTKKKMIVSYAVIGLEGLKVGHFANLKKIMKNESFKKLLGGTLKTSIMVTHSGILGLKFGTNKGVGLLLNAGTFNYGVGLNMAGECMLVNDWGDNFNVSVSGYDLGKLIIKRAFEEIDHKYPTTIITHKVLDLFRVKNEFELYTLLEKANFDKILIAQAARLLNDPEMVKLPFFKAPFTNFLIENVRSIQVLLTQLKFPSAKETEIVLSGGIFKNVPYLVKQLSLEILRITPAVDIKVLREPKVLGGLEMAHKLNMGEQIIAANNLSFMV